jgi:anti-sigma regulatory factor (Ser/Thr protein kinase)
LSVVRQQARSFLSDSLPRAGGSADQKDAVERAVMALDELASNALRHGRPPTSVELSDQGTSWLIVAVDTAIALLPVPATGRLEGQGGYGMYLIADFALAHGTHVTGDRKRVWAQLPKG